MKNPPYQAMHYVYTIHEDIEGNASIATASQMDIADDAMSRICNIFNQHKRIIL